MTVTEALSPASLLKLLNGKRGEGNHLRITPVDIAEACDQLNCGAEDFRSALDQLSAQGKVQAEQRRGELLLTFPDDETTIGGDEFSFDDTPAQTPEEQPDAVVVSELAVNQRIPRRRRRRKSRKANKERSRSIETTVDERIASLRAQVNRLRTQLEAKTKLLAWLESLTKK